MGRSVIDEIANRYGKLLVLHQVGYRNGQAVWLCHCDCGGEIEVRGGSLRKGDTQSCGCIQEKIRRARFIDRTGHRFGRLTVLNQVESKKGKIAWLCHCDCGEEVEVLSESLKSENTKSCGCLRIDRIRETHCLPVGEAAFNALVRSTKHGAERRGLIWNLTNEQVRSLSSKPCHYCGVMPAQHGTSSRYNGVYLYNGIDRIDNIKGYTIDNVTPCCDICNGAKCKMTQSDFLAWIRRLCAFRKDLEAKNEALP